MDVKDLRVEAVISEQSNDVTANYTQNNASYQFPDKNKTYHELGSNSLGKVDVQTTRPCAVIGPDRIVPQPEPYSKRVQLEPWQYIENGYRRPLDYPLKINDYQNPTRNISPRQTYQENMQRINVPSHLQQYNTAKLSEEQNLLVDKTSLPSKNTKSTALSEGKYCDVPYTVNILSNEHKDIRNPDLCVPSVKPTLVRSVTQPWPPVGPNIRPHPYGSGEQYRYPEYPSCAMPRSLSMVRPHRTGLDDPAQAYSDAYYRGNIRFEPYPTAKERYPQLRCNYPGNYIGPYHHPPHYPQQKPDMQKLSQPPVASHSYPACAPMPVKYLDGKIREPHLGHHQRSLNPQTNYNVPFHAQGIHPNYMPAPGNYIPNKSYPNYAPEVTVNSPTMNKSPYENQKLYNIQTKNYPPESFYLNDTRSHNKVQMAIPNYAPNMHALPQYPYYRKDINYDIPIHLKSTDLLYGNQISRIPPHFSPNIVSPPESNTSIDTNLNYVGSQEDCGYVSQSSTNSVRSIDSNMNMYKMYDPRYSYPIRNSPVTRSSTNCTKSERDNGKKDINVRQFLQMWNEGDEESESKEVKVNINTTNSPNFHKQGQVVNNQEQLYILGSVNVPSEELSKYEHIQKVSKLPDNIKGFTSIELLNQFEEAIESSNLNINFSSELPRLKETPQPVKTNISRAFIDFPLRPISPLDVEAKISQSIIHKEVGCNFEIKPCSPKMMNVEMAAPVQAFLGERVIEKVNNPVIIKPINPDTKSEAIKRSEREDIQNSSSCKMIHSKYASNISVDHIKSSISMQDLESNSEAWATSLPRLDHDIELSFTEVNQQFINANKTDYSSTPPPKDLPILDIETSCAPSICKDTVLKENRSNSPPEKEYTKLSKYRKLRTSEKHNTPPISPIRHAEVIRTDSVIIKNPENNDNILEDKLHINKSDIDTVKHLSKDLNILHNNSLFESARQKNQHQHTKTEPNTKSDYGNKKNDDLLDLSCNSSDKESFAINLSLNPDTGNLNQNMRKYDGLTQAQSKSPSISIDDNEITNDIINSDKSKFIQVSVSNCSSSVKTDEIDNIVAEKENLERVDSKFPELYLDKINKDGKNSENESVDLGNENELKFTDRKSQIKKIIPLCDAHTIEHNHDKDCVDNDINQTNQSITKPDDKSACKYLKLNDNNRQSEVETTFQPNSSDIPDIKSKADHHICNLLDAASSVYESKKQLLEKTDKDVKETATELPSSITTSPNLNIVSSSELSVDQKQVPNEIESKTPSLVNTTKESFSSNDHEMMCEIKNTNINDGWFYSDIDVNSKESKALDVMINVNIEEKLDMKVQNFSDTENSKTSLELIEKCYEFSNKNEHGLSDTNFKRDGISWNQSSNNIQEQLNTVDDLSKTSHQEERLDKQSFKEQYTEKTNELLATINETEFTIGVIHSRETKVGSRNSPSLHEILNVCRDKQFPMEGKDDKEINDTPEDESSLVGEILQLRKGEACGSLKHVKLKDETISDHDGSLCDSIEVLNHKHILTNDSDKTENIKENAISVTLKKPEGEKDQEEYFSMETIKEDNIFSLENCVLITEDRGVPVSLKPLGNEDKQNQLNIIKQVIPNEKLEQLPTSILKKKSECLGSQIELGFKNQLMESNDIKISNPENCGSNNKISPEDSDPSDNPLVVLSQEVDEEKNHIRIDKNKKGLLQSITRRKGKVKKQKKIKKIKIRKVKSFRNETLHDPTWCCAINKIDAQISDLSDLSEDSANEVNFNQALNKRSFEKQETTIQDKLLSSTVTDCEQLDYRYPVSEKNQFFHSQSEIKFSLKSSEINGEICITPKMETEVKLAETLSSLEDNKDDIGKPIYTKIKTDEYIIGKELQHITEKNIQNKSIQSLTKSFKSPSLRKELFSSRIGNLLINLEGTVHIFEKNIQCIESSNNKSLCKDNLKENTCNDTYFNSLRKSVCNESYIEAIKKLSKEITTESDKQSFETVQVHLEDTCKINKQLSREKVEKSSLVNQLVCVQTDCVLNNHDNEKFEMFGIENESIQDTDTIDYDFKKQNTIKVPNDAGEPNLKICKKKVENILGQEINAEHPSAKPLIQNTPIKLLNAEGEQLSSEVKSLRKINEDLIKESSKTNKESFTQESNILQLTNNTSEMKFGENMCIVKDQTKIMRKEESFNCKTWCKNKNNLSKNVDKTEFPLTSSNMHSPKRNHKVLKRSLSESELYKSSNRSSIKDFPENESFNSIERTLWPNKRKRVPKVNDDFNHPSVDNVCSFVQSRRNSVATFYNGDFSLCILIDDDCIIAEEGEFDDEAICFTDINRDNIESIVNEDIICQQTETENINCLPQSDTTELCEPFTEDSENHGTNVGDWVDDIACVETVISDDIEDDNESLISNYDIQNCFDNSDSDLYDVGDYTKKMKKIYGDEMCSNDINLIKTLYSTPQMNVNRTLHDKESHSVDDNSDCNYLERILSDEPETYTFDQKPKILHQLQLIEDKQPAYEYSGKFEEAEEISNKTVLEESFESSNINKVLSTQDIQISESCSSRSSCSPEVSSTTSEDKKSSILLTITNYKGSRISHINDDIGCNKKIRCKFTENSDYSTSKGVSPNIKTLLTKAAQKYIPPLKETIPDLKVKLRLPSQSLIKLKQLKEAKTESKQNSDTKATTKHPLNKKPKPKFEDVLKSIDEIQFRLHKDKGKKVKKPVPKVIIKKSENGSHYTSMPDSDSFNPDLTGRKWQPWVFIEKNYFVDRMALRRRTRAVYNHRRKTYVLAENFQKYKSVGTKFIITQPNLENMSTAPLKCTIKLKQL